MNMCHSSDFWGRNSSPLRSSPSLLLGSLNRSISDFADASSKFPPLRSGTSDMPQPLYAIRLYDAKKVNKDEVSK